MHNNELDFENSLVSIILPVYNGEKFVAEALNSITTQTYKNLEIIVVNDGSTDETANIVRSFVKADRRISLLSQANAGVAAARNLGIEHSQGEFIALIDADDIWYPENIAKQIQLMKLEPSVGLTYAWSAYIDEQSTFTGGIEAACYQGDVYLPLVSGNFVGNASAVLIRRSCLEKVGTYNSQLKAQDAQGCEDWELYLRIAKHYQFGVIPEFLIGYRQVTGSMSCNYKVMLKSYQLIMSDIQRLNPQIPLNTYIASQINYYRYFFDRSYYQKEYQYSLLWLYRIFILDRVFFAEQKLYKQIIKSFLNLMVRPFLLLMPPKANPQANKTQITITQLNKKAAKNWRLIS